MSESKPTIVGIILAAGQSRRMGTENKLVRMWNEKPLVQHVFDAAQASELSHVAVVTGHEADLVEFALQSVNVLHNERYEQGMGTSIARGVQHACEEFNPDGVMVLLGDMPLVTAEHINALLSAFQDGGKKTSIICATNEGKRGNPVLFGKDWFESLLALSEDQGARELIQSNTNVMTVEIGEAGSVDFDTLEAFRAVSSSSEH